MNNKKGNFHIYPRCSLPFKTGASPRSKKTRITLRFLRDVEFPRFKMSEGETWDCYREHGTGKDYLEAVAHGEDRFCFAGGICLVEDVEIVEGLED